ncbi:MAG: enoyl-CoA hydratase/isomerase family protein [Burkholderiaceae bacterium]|jgi:enoyl-CoA hydratase/carnithine racemase|nr:enoyl-CoA hydratase/isomerase family protein [Burkholderiaceae bacterium]MDG1109767.1 enoyl-CoA hydratase/isomerase family protein [Burkholderiaceae bacterium]
MSTVIAVTADGTPAVRWRYVSDGVAEVCISNPTRMNAMTVGMWAELREAFETLSAQPLSAIVLTGDPSGHAFCAGGDIQEYPAFRFDATSLAHFHEAQVWPGLRAILNCDIPVIAHINGTCMGAGLELACCADIRLAHSDAVFGAPIAKLGFPMAPKEAAVVASVLGTSVARNILLQAATYRAELLHHMGFLAEIHPAQDLDKAVTRVANKVRTLAPEAARLNKQLLRDTLPDSLGLRRRDANQAYAYAGSAEHREGVTAFIAKRSPRFGASSDDA